MIAQKPTTDVAGSCRLAPFNQTAGNWYKFFPKALFTEKWGIVCKQKK
jgi:hypothetical protein